MSVRASNGVAGGLLRAHVGRGADRQAGLGQRDSRGAQRPRDAEVGDQRAAVAREQDVLGLDVPVDHAVLVGVFERSAASRVIRSASSTGSWRSRRSRSRSDSPSTKGIVNQMARGFAGVEHGEDVRVLEPGRELDLALEPLGAERLG